MILRHFKASDYEPNNDLDYASFTDYHFARLFVHMLKKDHLDYMYIIDLIY